MNSRNLFITGFILVLAVNSIVLAGVAYNRSGEPESVATLSDREIRIHRSYAPDFQNSGVSLRIEWQALGRENNPDDRYYYTDRRSPVWLDEKKLEELGFDIGRYKKNDTNNHQELLEKEVCLVLENNGEAYREALKRAEKAFAGAEASKAGANVNSEEIKDRLESAENSLKNEKESNSRLFVIDAGLDVSALRNKYPDKNRYIITKGIVRPEYDYSDDNKPHLLKGRISRLGVEFFHLPLEYAKKLESVQKIQKDKGYEIGLFYGKRLEPWIRDIREIEDNDSR